MSEELLQAAEKALETFNRMEYNWSYEEQIVLAQLGNAIAQEKGEDTRYVFAERIKRNDLIEKYGKDSYMDDNDEPIDLVIYNAQDEPVHRAEEIPRFLAIDILLEKCEENGWEYIR